MIEVSKVLLLVLGELLLLSVLYAVSVQFTALAKRRRDRAAIRQLIVRIREDSGRRESETRKILEERFGLSGDNLEATVHRIAREEKLFYQTLIDVYLRRDTEALPNLSVDYEGSVDAYRTMTLPKPADAGVAGDETDDRSEELILLKTENQRLAEELQLTMDTMGNMLSEYTQMFAADADLSLDREKMQEIAASDEPRERVPAADQAASQDEPPLTGTADADGSAEQPATEDYELKALDEELGMLELSEEDLLKEEGALVGDLDETLVVAPNADPAVSDREEESGDEEDEVINLDDVLDDPDTRSS